jgi:hypothetical protein
MSNTLSNLSHIQSAPPFKAARQATPQAKAQTAATDTVNLSNAQASTRAISQELTETSAQTAKEAAGGDIQARNLLAKRAAAKAYSK